MKIISKAEAIKQGRKTYYTGKPCPKGHVAEIFVSGRCRTCTLESTARNRAAKKAKNGKAKKAKTTLTDTAADLVMTSAALVNALTEEGVIGEPVNKDWNYYVSKINAVGQKTVGGFVEMGRLFNEAKSNLDHGEWLKLVEELRYSEDTIQRLMAIARHPVISDTERVRYLPPNWGTLYQLTRLPEPVLLARIEDHTIKPDMQRKEVAALFGPERQTKRNNKPKPGEHFAAMAQEIEDQKAHIAELEAAREAKVIEAEVIEATPDYFDDDAPTMARKIVMVIGRERAALLVVELQKLINPRGEPNNDE